MKVEINLNDVQILKNKVKNGCIEDKEILNIIKKIINYNENKNNKELYEEYLLSDEWKLKKDKAISRANNKCQVCSAKTSLVVHHNSYDNVDVEKGIFNEQESDLIVLCNNCHKLFHNNKNKVINNIKKNDNKINNYTKNKDVKINKTDNLQLIQTFGAYDGDIMKFIRNFGSITVKQATWMFYGHENNARRSLKRLESKGNLISYKHTNGMKELAFTSSVNGKVLKYHEILINDFYAKLIKEGCKIIKVDKTPIILSGKRRPDLYIEYVKDDKMYNSYLEVDLTHFTDFEKINDYDLLYKNSDKKFNLIIMKDDELGFNYYGDINIKHLPLKDFNITE